ncbi:MAG: PorT family protein [Marinifilum sp.]|jgi:hypothetical protein|nr:PorT family protein [Marinifilum sp.]
MKKLFTLLLSCFLVTVFYCANAQVKFGIKTGLNLADIAQDFKDSDDEDDTKINLGLSLGVIAEYEFNEKLALQSGLLFTQKGFKEEYKEENYEGEDKWKVNYLEVPMNFAYKMNKFQLYAGPYVAFGISGKYEWEETYNGETESGDYDIVFGNDSSKEKEDEIMLRGFDYGLNFGVGYQAGSFLFNAGYSFGLANLKPDDKSEDSDFDPKDYKISNRVLSFSVAYFFGGK